ncbi:hypothetical protein FACS1894130_03230 [Spirochaetia bacterium]|nr:hypothetical protein FACS1894130_03230 [Spirochaetia bacterium]
MMMTIKLSIQTLLRKLAYIQSYTAVRLLVICILGIQGITGLWAGALREAGGNTGTFRGSPLVLGMYKIEAAAPEKGDLYLQLLLDGGKYYLQTEGYTKYILGCYDEGNNWYVWNHSADQWTIADSKTVNVLKEIKSAAGDTKPAVKNLMPGKAAQNGGYETGFEIRSFRRAAAAPEPAGMANLHGRRIGAPLPSGGLPQALSGGSPAARMNMVLALYKSPGRSGDIIVFSRPSGWFAGEAELFSSTSALRGKPYTAKALSLLYEYFKAQGAGEAFKACAQQYYPDVDLNLLSAINAAEKRDILIRFANVLAGSIKQRFEQRVNGKTVFSEQQIITNSILYGDARNIYIDAYLLFCFSRNRPVFTGSINAADEAPFDPQRFRQISSAESLTLARNAMRYFTWGVEYTVPQIGDCYYKGGDFFHSIISNYSKTVKSWDSSWLDNADTQYRGHNYWHGQTESLRDLPQPTWYIGSNAAVFSEALSFDDIKPYPGLSFDTPFANGKSGYPLPYTKGGSDSPRSFAGKMADRARNQIDGILRDGPDRVTTRLISGLPDDAGVDSIGILSGSISMMGEFAEALYERTGGGAAENSETHRIRAEDLERISMVIPDLSLARPGDMVVRFREEERNTRTADIGIIVGFRNGSPWPPAYGGDQRHYMKNILLVTALEEQGQVRLVFWDSSPESPNSFTADPASFHLRRLIRLREGASAEAGRQVQPWDMLDPLPVKMEARIRGMEEQDRRAGKNIRERWIPNTGEYLVLHDIRIGVENSAGIVLNTTNEPGMEVFISGAVDRGYDPKWGTAVYGNIYNNSGNSKFEVALISESKTEVYPIGILESDNAGRYRMTWPQSVLYTTDGVNKHTERDEFKQNRFWINAEGKLVGRYGGNGKVFYPGIRPLSPHDAKPGDDLILEFGVREKGAAEPLRFELNGAVREARFLTAEGDYIAVYDKKLLWRANLYIDEGIGDWNDIHPWAAPAAAGAGGPVWWDPGWGLNDWNRPKPGTQISGGQVTEIASWTRWSDNATITTAAAYGWGSWDSVFSFNEELNEQQQLIGAARTREQEHYQSGDFERLQWTRDSIAPGRDWKNYVFPARKPVNNLLQYNKTLSQAELAETEQHRYFVNGSAVSVPGLSTYWEMQNPSQYEYNQVLRTSGLDCSGLAHRAALYDGSPYYVAKNSASKYGTTTFGDDEKAALLIRGRGWQLEDLADQAGRDKDRDLISRAVPGDLFVRSGVHVVIIHDLEQGADTDQITAYSQVKIIHSTQGSNSAPTWMVQRDTWSALGNTDKTNYKLMRYK